MTVSSFRQATIVGLDDQTLAAIIAIVTRHLEQWGGPPSPAQVRTASTKD